MYSQNMIVEHPNHCKLALNPSIVTAFTRQSCSSSRLRHRLARSKNPNRPHLYRARMRDPNRGLQIYPLLQSRDNALPIVYDLPLLPPFAYQSRPTYSEQIAMPKPPSVTHTALRPTPPSIPKPNCNIQRFRPRLFWVEGEKGVGHVFFFFSSILCIPGERKRKGIRNRLKEASRARFAGKKDLSYFILITILYIIMIIVFNLYKTSKCFIDC